MTRNPYERGGENWAEDSGSELVGEQRLSLLALFSLIFSLICLLPGLGVLGVIFGASALILIGKSRGRLSGKGLAITGVVLGLIVSVIWGSMVVGFGQAFRFYRDRIIPPVAILMEHAGSDAAQARASLTPGAAKSVTDEDLAQFAAGAEAHYGAFRHAPTGFGTLITTFRDSLSAGQDQQISGGSQGVPVPMVFERGAALVFVIYDESTFDDKQPRFEDAMIMLPGRKALTLRKGGRARDEALSLGLEPVYGEAALPEAANAPAGEQGGAGGG